MSSQGSLIGRVLARAAFAALGLALTNPASVFAQNAEIAGVVRDASGAVLPGVTVEAASPSLIERSRVVYTDGQGQYRVIALTPGAYTVTFTLPGFNTTVREGIVLTAAFTATVDASLTVGAVSETVTVSGQTPLVDIQATTQRRALTSEMLNELPTGRSFQNLAILVPGVQMPLIYQDVGGSDGNRWQTLKVHGSRDDQMPLLLNGLSINNMNNTGGGYNHTLAVNTGTVQEMTVTTSGSTAEVKTSGVVANTLVKEGGNQFSGYVYTDFTNGSLQSDNLSSDLVARGLTAVNRVKRVGEINPTFGGPIVKNRLWFYGGYRFLTSQKYLAGSFQSKDPRSPVYCNQPAGCNYLTGFVPDSRDLTKQDFSGDKFHNTYTGNLTWQISRKNKVNLFYHLGRRHLDNDSSVTQTPEATSYLYSAPDYVAQAQWTNPLTSRLLLEGGFNFFNETWWWWQPPDTGVPVGDGPSFPVVRFEVDNGAIYGANFVNIRAYNHQYNMRFAVNYVTGTHAFKFGVNDMWGTRNFRYQQNNSQFHIMFQGLPVQLTQYAYPYEDLEHLKAALGVYAQDRWSVNRLTFNLGVRFDYHNAYIPAQSIAAIPFVGAKQYDALLDSPSWKDISPRLGVSWDIRGDAKTVVRFNYGHYLASESVSTATANNPVNTRINSASRPWADANLNYLPDCNLTSPLANGECGPLSAPLGETEIVTRWDPSVLRGWGVRPSDDEFLVGLQQQFGRLMADVQWTYHSFGNLFATQYLATPASSYDTFCITAPTDARLRDGGGSQQCGYVDVKPAFFGVRPDNLVTGASKLGDVTDVFTGVDLTLTMRLARGGVASGGVSTGRERTDICDIATKAQQGSNSDSSLGKIFLDNYVGNNITNSSRSAVAFPSAVFCRVTPPFQPDWKGLVTYPLPLWGLSASATWQNRAGPPILANLPVTGSTNTLGRAPTLAALTAPLIEPGTQYADRLNQIDVRLAKTFRLGKKGRLQGTLSVFNLLNANSALTLVNTYGPTWLTPSLILQGRLVKFGAQYDF